MLGWILFIFAAAAAGIFAVQLEKNRQLRFQIEKDAEYTRNLQIRIINQLRDDLSKLDPSRFETEYKDLLLRSEAARKERDDIQQQIRTETLYLENIKKELGLYEGHTEILSYGLYSPQFDFGTSEEYKDAIKKNRESQAGLIKEKTAAVCGTEWTVDGDKRKGAQMTARNVKLMLRAFNGECDAAVARVRWNNYDQLRMRIDKAFEAINKMGEPNAIRITNAYLILKRKELSLAYEYQDKLQQEREEQRQIREQMREEEKARKEIEKALRDAAREEEAIQKALGRLRAQMEQSNAEERAKYEDQIAELEQKWKEAEERNRRALSMAQQTKRGHVYIVSNIGSFGENVYKIGMTRRLEPLDRVRELGGASVPFSFDVHAMLWSEDAPALENALHKKFALGQVNKVNHRKEFFRTSIEEIRRTLESEGIEAKWTMAAEAMEYYETLSIEKALENDQTAREAWLDRQLILEDKDIELRPLQDDEQEVEEAV